MKILMTTISLDPERGSGCAGRTYHLVRHLARLGHECTVASIEDGAFADRLRQEGVAAHAFGYTQVRFPLPHIRPGKLASLVREADIVHILGYWNMLSVATAFTATRLDRPYVLSAAGEFVGLEPPVVLHKNLFHRSVGRRMVGGAGGLVAVTALEKEQIIDRLAIAPRLVDVVPNGVEPPAPEGPDRAPAPTDRPYVLFMGRLAGVKGPDLLIEAFAAIAAEHPGLALVMGGQDSGMRAELEAAVARHGLEERVLFTGHLDEAARGAAYRDALFLVVPSRSEAMSLVALEAGMMGTPVLLTDRCGFDEINAVGGGLVVPASVDGLVGGLRAMLDQREELPEKGRALRDYAMRNFAWPKAAAKLVAGLQRAARPQEPPTSRYGTGVSSLSSPSR